MKSAVRTWTGVIFSAVAALSLSGCIGVEKLSDATLATYGLTQIDPAACASGTETFRTAVFPYLDTNCAGCHSVQSPAFATGDAATSYAPTKALVNFSSIPTSRIYIRSTDGHCGSAGCQKSGTEIAAALKTWGTAETKATTTCTNPGGTTGGVVNQGVLLRVNGVIQQQILSASQQAGLCVPYQVALVKDGVAGIAINTVQVSLSGGALFSDSTCKVAATSVPIAVGQSYQNFYVMEAAAGDRTILGSIAGYAVGFTIQLSITAPAPSPTPSPSPRPSVTPSPTPTATPTATPTPSPTPTPAPTACSSTQKMNAYSATAWPVLKTNCASCHSTVGLPAFASATLSTAYPIARALVTPTTPTDSKLYIKSKDGHCGTACGATTGASLLTQMNLWFPAETSTNCSSLTTPH